MIVLLRPNWPKGKRSGQADWPIGDRPFSLTNREKQTSAREGNEPKKEAAQSASLDSLLDLLKRAFETLVELTAKRLNALGYLHSCRGPCY